MDDYEYNFPDDFDEEITRARRPKKRRILIIALILMGIIIGIFFLRKLPERNSSLLIKNATPSSKFTTNTIIANTPFQPTASVILLPVSPTSTSTAFDEPGIHPVQNSVIVSYGQDGNLLKVKDVNGLDVPLPPGMEQSIPTTNKLDLSRINEIGLIKAAFYDPQMKRLVLVGDPPKKGEPPYAMDNLEVSLQGVMTGQNLGLSIDPGPSKDTLSIRYIGPSEGTMYGLTMFEADRLMKNLSLGEDNITHQSLIPMAPPGHQTMFDFIHNLSTGTSPDIKERFWIVVDKMQLDQTKDGNGIYFRNVKLHVNTEILDKDWQPLSNPPIDLAGQAFADQLTQNFNVYAEKFRILNELEAAARWTAVSHWLKDASIPGINAILLENVQKIVTPKTTPPITVQKSYTTTNGNLKNELKLEIWGGINLTFNNDYQPVENIEQSKSDSIAYLPLSSLQKKARYKIGLPDMNITPDKQFSLMYVSDKNDLDHLGPGWSLELPHLIFPSSIPSETLINKEDENYLIFADPTTDKQYTLTFSGNLAGAIDRIYTNQEAGLVLIRNQNEYTLQDGIISGTGITLTGKFKQTFSDNGNIVQWITNQGQATKFTYDNKKLQLISNQDGEIGFEYNAADRVTNIINRLTHQEYQFVYNNLNLLTELLTKDGIVVHKWGYDEQSRLHFEWTETNQVARQIEYDQNGNLLAQALPSRAEIYDWQDNNSAKVYVLDEGYHVWIDAFGEKELTNLGIAVRLYLNQTTAKHLVYFRRQDKNGLMFIDGKTYSLSNYDFRDEGQLRKVMKQLIPNLNTNDIILVLDGDGRSVDFQTVFPEVRWLYTEGLDFTQIQANLGEVPNLPALTNDNTRLILSIPEPDQLSAIGLPVEDKPLWVDVRKTFENVALKWHYLNEGSSLQPVTDLAKEIEQALEDKDAVLIVTAHSDGQQIFLPNGKSFKPGDLDFQSRELIKFHRPVVILLACEAGKNTEINSLAKQFLDLGARFVLAPDEKISAFKTSDFLDQLFRNSTTNTNLVDALQQTMSEIRIRLFPFIGQIPSPFKRS